MLERPKGSGAVSKRFLGGREAFLLLGLRVWGLGFRV